MAEGQITFRPLHLEKAFDVLDAAPRTPESYRAQPRAMKAKGCGRYSEEVLVMNARARFAANRIRLSGTGSEIEGSLDEKFAVLTVLQGAVSVLGKNKETEAERVACGHSILIPAAASAYHLRSESEMTEAIKSYVP